MAIQKMRMHLLAGVSLTVGLGLAGGAFAQVVDYPDGSTNAAPVVLATDTVQLQVTTGSATQAGVISETGGSHGFEKIGAGNLTLTAANTYSGDTLLTAGGLTISNTQALGAGALVVADYGNTTARSSITVPTLANDIVMQGGYFELHNTGPLTISGAISGSGTLIFNLGNAVGEPVILTGTNTFTGVLYHEGLLQIGDGGTNGSVVADIETAPESVVRFNRSDDFVYSGRVSANTSRARIEKVGAGTMILTGEIFAGPNTTFITEGTLNIGGGGTNGEVRFGRLQVAAGAHVIADRSNDSNFTGMSGAGSFEKRGAGTLTLTSLLNNTGGVTVNAGTLRIGDGTGAGDAALNADVTVAAGAIVTFVGGSVGNTSYAYNMSGGGLLRKQNENTLFLTGTNTNTGGVEIMVGTVQVGTGGVTGSITGPVNIVSGVLAFNRSDTLTFAGDITGVGSLRQLGTGTLIVTGNANHQVGTDIRAGTLSIGDGGTTGFVATNILNDSVLVFNRSDAVTYGYRVSGTGSLTKLGAGDLTLTNMNSYFGGTTISAGTLRIGDGGTTGSIRGAVLNNATLAFNRSDAVTYSDVISGSGALVKQGAGTLTLSGTNLYTGATTVSAGRLNVTGSIAGSAVTVASGAILSGTGPVGSTTISSGGVLGSTGPTGVLSIAGGLGFASGSSFMVDLTPASASRVNVTGAASLNGVVTAAYAPGDYIAKQYTILNAQGGLTGTFASLTNINLPAGFGSSLSYDANNVYVDLEILLPTYSGLDQNQAGVANAIADYFDRTGGIDPIYAQLTVDQLNAVAGETGMVGVSTGARVVGGLLSAFSDQMSDTPRGQDRGLAWDGGGGGWQLWGRLDASTSTIEADDSVGYSETEITHQQVLVGADRALTSDLLLGIAYAAGTADFEDQRGGRGDADFSNLGIYGRFNAGNAYVGFGATFGSMDSTITRTVRTGVTDVLRSEVESDILGARLEAGLDTRYAGVGVQPYVSAQTIRVDIPGYSEVVVSGADTYALTYASEELNAYRFELGGRFEANVSRSATSSTKLSFLLAAVHDDGDSGLTAHFTALPGSTFTSRGAVADGPSVLVGTGISARFGPGLSLSASVRGQFGAQDSADGQVTVRYAW